MINETTKNRLPLPILVIGVIVCCFLVIFFIITTIQKNKSGDYATLNSNFSGRVTSIYYDIKQFPTVVVGDSAYYIGAGYDTDHQISVGDSIFKKNGSNTYKVIKPNGKVIFFNK